MNTQKKQAWIQSSVFDSVFILLPPFVCLFIAMLLPEAYRTSALMPLAGWVILVLLVDVTHVYSTLFRTYLDNRRFKKQRATFIAVPVCCYVIGVLLYSVSALLFWRTLAYLAVFHFIRQQYGFMRLYSRFDLNSRTKKIIDAVAIYAATLYPILYWHLTPGRNFSWFIDGDFIALHWSGARGAALVVYAAIFIVYFFSEIAAWPGTRHFNIPKNVLVAGTVVSWYFGIVYYNGDLAFTLLNVVSHGIPYIALIWTTARREQGRAPGGRIPAMFLRSYGVLLFIGLMILFAYLEEGLWDGLIWREHKSIFSVFSALPKIADTALLAIVVPLLSLPQSTHYILDGFIWRRKDALPSARGRPGQPDSTSADFHQ